MSNYCFAFHQQVILCSMGRMQSWFPGGREMIAAMVGLRDAASDSTLHLASTKLMLFVALTC